jgi:hypothetical protein
MGNLKPITARELIEQYGRLLNSRDIVVLDRLASDDPEEQELVFQAGFGAWIGFERISGGVFSRLVRACAIRRQGSEGKEVEHYVISETGRALLAAVSSRSPLAWDFARIASRRIFMDSVEVSYEPGKVALTAEHGPIRVIVALSPSQAEKLAALLLAHASAARKLAP